MSFFSAIRDILAIKKDRIETKKAELEIKKLEEEAQYRKSIIEKAYIEDVKKYDPKTKKLLEELREIDRESSNDFGLTYCPPARSKVPGWLIWICLLTGVLVFLYFKFMR